MRGVPDGEHIFGAALIGVGLFALYKANSLPLGSLREPGAGFFPAVITVALILFAGLAINGRNPAADKAQAGSPGIARIWILTAMTAIYAWALPSIGFLLCTAVLLGVMLRGLGEVGWLPTIVCAVGGAAGCYFVFTRLGMPLPAGVVGF